MKSDQWLQLQSILEGSTPQNIGVSSLGEFGLDYSCDVPPHKQKNVMLDHLALAQQHQLSMVLHFRQQQAYNEGLDMIKNYADVNLPMHFHCYMGDENTLNDILQSFPSSYIGFTGAVCSSTELHAIVRKVPIERLLLETDAPYFPVSHASTVSLPHNINEIGEKVASIKNLSASYVHEMNVENCTKIYKFT